MIEKFAPIPDKEGLTLAKELFANSLAREMKRPYPTKSRICLENYMPTSMQGLIHKLASGNLEDKGIDYIVRQLTDGNDVSRTETLLAIFPYLYYANKKQQNRVLDALDMLLNQDPLCSFMKKKDVGLDSIYKVFEDMSRYLTGAPLEKNVHVDQKQQNVFGKITDATLSCLENTEGQRIVALSMEPYRCFSRMMRSISTSDKLMNPQPLLQLFADRAERYEKITREHVKAIGGNNKISPVNFIDLFAKTGCRRPNAGQDWTKRYNPVVGS